MTFLLKITRRTGKPLSRLFWASNHTDARNIAFDYLKHMSPDERENALRLTVQTKEPARYSYFVREFDRPASECVLRFDFDTQVAEGAVA